MAFFSMPTDRTENSLLYHLPVWGGWKQLELAATSTYILRQDRIPVGLDFAEPPGVLSSYRHKVQASSGPYVRGELRFGVEGANLFNVAYRDYLDRFRYYADARGIDLTCWARYSFGK
jgi:iron complex outermembrane receptor protein